MRIHHPLRIKRTSPAVCLAAACLTTGGLGLTAGCSAAPAGATSDSPVMGPVRTGAAAEKFVQFPVPSKWPGEQGKDYTMVVKPKTGTVPRKFGFTATSSVVFWLSCIGTGTARLSSPAINLNWGVPCGTGADPAGITVTPPRAAQGTTVKVLVTAPPGTHWEIRVDARLTPKAA